MKHPIFSKLRSYLISGLLLTTPLFLTVAILAWIVNSIDQIMETFLPSPLVVIPGLGLLIALAFLVLIGSMGKGVLGKIMIVKSEEMLRRLPIVRSLYGGIKQILDSFFDKETRSFHQVGLIEYPRAGAWTICFLSAPPPLEVSARMDPHAMITVFVPTTPNPTSGFLLFVKESDFHPLDMKVDEGLKLTLSMGVVNSSVETKDICH